MENGKGALAGLSAPHPGRQPVDGLHHAGTGAAHEALVQVRIRMGAGGCERLGTVEIHHCDAHRQFDGGTAEKIALPTNRLIRKNPPFWKYQLPQGTHSVHLKVLNPTSEAEIALHDVIIYGEKPASIMH